MGASTGGVGCANNGNTGIKKQMVSNMIFMSFVFMLFVFNVIPTKEGSAGL